MATVTGKTSDEIDALLSDLVVGGAISESGELTLTTRDGSTIDVGTINPPASALDAWPVGSIFMAATATSPSILLGGGTWTAWGTGRVPIGVDTGQTEFNTLEKTGGEKTHTLDASEMPSHLHSINHDHPSATTSSDTHNHTTPIRYSIDGGNAGSVATVRDVGGLSHGGGSAGNAATTNDTHNHTVDLPAFSGNSGNAGGGGAHNNLQPYITCYMWKRTA